MATTKQKRKRRIFIVAPTAAWPHDIIHHVCSTVATDDIGDIYDRDDFEIVETCYSMPDALRAARRRGSKRPKVI